MKVNDLKLFLSDLEDREPYREFVEWGSEGDKVSLSLSGVSIELEMIHRDRINSDAIRVFKCNDKLFRLDGYYDSYSGTSFDDIIGGIYEVEAKEKNITVYE